LLAACTTGSHENSTAKISGDAGVKVESASTNWIRPERQP